MNKTIISIIVVVSLLTVPAVQTVSAGVIQATPISQVEVNEIENAQANSQETVEDIQCGDSGDAALGALICIGILAFIGAAAADG